MEKTVGTWAFGPFPSIDVVSPELARLQPACEAILAELKSGRFDAGFAPRSFKDDVAALRPASDVPEFSVKLANADHFCFDRYVTPQYPPLAKQARVSGTVELELTSNPNTGETEQVTVISGSPLLAGMGSHNSPAVILPPGVNQTNYRPFPNLAAGAEFLSSSAAATIDPCRSIMNTDSAMGVCVHAQSFGRPYAREYGCIKNSRDQFAAASLRDSREGAVFGFINLNPQNG